MKFTRQGGIYQHYGHGLCGSHLLCELTLVVDANGYRWARTYETVATGNLHQGLQKPGKKLSEKELGNLQKRFRTILMRGKKELPSIPPKPSGKRGKLGKSDAHNLWERLKAHEESVLLCAKDPHVPFTNNRGSRI